MACQYWPMMDTAEQPEPVNPTTITGHPDGHQSGRHVAEQPAVDADQAVEGPPGTAPVTGAQAFNLKEAAELTGLSVSTMRRRRGELAKLGATVTEDGIWSIPITALEAAGLLSTTRPEKTDQPEPSEQPQAPHGAPGSPSPAAGVAQERAADGDALDRLRELEEELRDARERLAKQERQRIHDQHRAELAEVRQAAAEQRARAAEVLAEERRQTLEVERRMLTAGPSVYAPSWPSSAAPPAEPQEQPSPEPEPAPASQQGATRPADTATPERPVQQPAAEQSAAASPAPSRPRWWDPRTW
jgi:hypothetical protein